MLKIDDSALEKCTDVTVYGTKGSEAERFAKAAGFKFVDFSSDMDDDLSPTDREEPPVELPIVRR